MLRLTLPAESKVCKTDWGSLNMLSKPYKIEMKEIHNHMRNSIFMHS